MLLKFNLESISKPISDSIWFCKWILLNRRLSNLFEIDFRANFRFNFAFQVAFQVTFDNKLLPKFNLKSISEPISDSIFAFQVAFVDRLPSKFNLESISKPISDSILLSEWLLIANCYQSSTWNWFRSRFQIQFCFPSDLC